MQAKRLGSHLINDNIHSSFEIGGDRLESYNMNFFELSRIPFFFKFNPKNILIASSISMDNFIREFLEI